MLIRGINTKTDGGRYLIACARIRNVTPVELVRQLLEVIGRDQLVLAILDDHEHPIREPNGPSAVQDMRGAASLGRLP